VTASPGATSLPRLPVNELNHLKDRVADVLETLWPSDPATPPVSIHLPAPSTGMFIARVASTGRVQTFTTAE